MSGSKKLRFVCRNCGFVSLKWEGCCPDCGKWNTLEEKELINFEILEKSNNLAAAQSLKEINIKNEIRYDLGCEEINVLFGGGLVKGSISLIGGDPGIGKSTLLLQICGNLAKKNKVLYVSGEENVAQIKLRANRLKINNENLLILSEVDIQAVIGVILKERPNVIIIDSIQTMNFNEVASASGSVSQVRECTYLLQKISKDENLSIILIGHVNKEGSIAGPKILEHIVDSVLYFEGDSKNSFRILRVVKNRFGSINEIVVFEMKEDGLVVVKNPSALLIEERPKNVSGNCVCAVMKGKRPLFVEVQSLVTKSSFGLPRRLCKGLDCSRVIIIIAVLEKRVGLFFNNADCYVNVVGGFKLDDPACDLAIAFALVAALKNLKINEDVVVLGEIGLAGEIRSVSGLERTISEAEKLGFNKIILPYSNLKNFKGYNGSMKLIGVQNVFEAVKSVFKMV